MNTQQEAPKNEGLTTEAPDLEARLYHVAQLAATAPTLDALVMADGVFTEDEQRMLLAFQAEKDGVGKETQSAAPGELTTRELVVLAWYRQQTDADQHALSAALTICDMIDTLWQQKGGAA